MTKDLKNLIIECIKFGDAWEDVKRRLWDNGYDTLDLQNSYIYYNKKAKGLKK